MITLTPAYGRDYKNRAAVIADLDAGKDFILNEYGNRYDGKPCSKGDLISTGITEVRVRWKAMSKVSIVEWPQ